MTLHTVKLTTSQKQTLVRIFTSPTPELAKAETEFGEKNIAAAEILKDLGVIEVDGETAVVTDEGKELMKQQGLIDDTDQLTADAEQFKAGDGNTNTEDGGDEMDLGGDNENEFGDEDFGGAFDGAESDDSDVLDPPDDLMKSESLMYGVNKLLKKS